MGDVSARARQLPVSVAPFVGVELVAWAVTAAASPIDWLQYGISVALLLVAVALSTAAIARPVPRAAVPGALVYLAAAGLLRNATGGFASGVGALAFIPVFQIALSSRRRRDLGWVLGALALFFVVPTVAIGGTAYPSTGYRTTVLVLAINGVIGWATQHLVARVREQAEEAQAREQRAERITAVVHSLQDSPAARPDVCTAARAIADATIALIYEPGGDGALVCTAIAGLDGDQRPAVAASGSAVAEAYRTGRPVLIEADVADRVGSHALWERAGRPAAVLYEPLRHRGATLGVLVVAWSDRIAGQSARTTVIALLAHEAAAVIDRADAVADLAGQALTDALTGLPNRRAWDAALERAEQDDVPLAVVMLDLDHFKRFNDAHGHAAGDHLLKAAAAVWRDQLRGVDLLARVGGEEFGLLLSGDGAGRAAEVVWRLRRELPIGATASAGLAIRGGDESPASVLGRADAALYAAKRAGRDRAYLSADASSSPAPFAPWPTRQVAAQTASASAEVAAPTTDTPAQPSAA